MTIRALNLMSSLKPCSRFQSWPGFIRGVCKHRASIKGLGPIEGHFVQGHVDTTCRIVGWQDQGAAKLLTLELEEPEYQKYIVPKGSVALDWNQPDRSPSGRPNNFPSP